MGERRDKWSAVVGIAWVMAIISVAVSAWMAYRFGLGEALRMNELNQSLTMRSINMPIVIGAVFQAAASILFGCLFSMMNSIYQTSFDIWLQNQSALRRVSK